MPSTIREAFARRMTLLSQATCRRKTGSNAEEARRVRSRRHLNALISQPEVDSSPSTVNTGYPAAWELGTTVISTSIPVAVFIVAGEQAVATAGPSAMCSVMLATAACSLTAYCQSHLPSRHQRYLYASVGGAYELLYRMCGEAIGYSVGWLLILYHCSFAALLARSVGLYTDSLLSATASNGSRTRTALELFERVINDSTVTSHLTTTMTAAKVPNGSSVSFDETGNDERHLDVITVVVSLSVITVAMTSSVLTETGGVRNVLSRLFLRESRSMVSLTQSFTTGSAITRSALVLGLLIFATAVSLSHGLHFANWNNVGHCFFAGEISGLLASTATFYFLFNTYDDVIRQIKSIRYVLGADNTSRQPPPSASAMSISVSVVLLSILAMSSICVIALTTLTPPMFGTRSPLSNLTVVLPGSTGLSASTTFSGSYVMANLGWMKRVVCVVAVTSLIPGAISQIQNAADVINKIASDGLLPSLLAGDRVPVNNSLPVIIVAISGGAVVATLTLVCSSQTLVGLISVVSLTVNSIIIGSILDAIYRPLDAVLQRRSRPRSSNRNSKESSTRLSASQPSLRSTDANASSILYGSNMSPAEGRFLFDDAAASSGSDVITECPTLSIENNESESESSRSSDTDIDDAVDDFQQTRLTVLAHYRQDDALIDVSCPDKRSHRRAVRSLVAFIVSIVVSTVMLAHARAWLSSSGVKSAAFFGCLVLGVLTSLTAVVYACFLPRNDEVLSMTSRGVVGARSTVRIRCASLVSIGINWSLMTLMESISYVVIFSWFLIGIVLYITYGMQHSYENDFRCQHFDTEEQRILLPVEDHPGNETTTSYTRRTDAHLQLSRDAVALC